MSLPREPVPMPWEQEGMTVDEWIAHMKENPPDPGDVVEQAKQALYKQLAEMSEIYGRAARSRGDFIAQVIFVEGQVDEVLEAFFEVPESKRLMFRSAVLSARGFGLHSKIRSLAEVLNDTGTKDKLPDLVGDLNRVNGFRNRLAHVGVGALAFLDDPERIFTLRWYEDGKEHEMEVTQSKLAEMGAHLGRAVESLQLLLRQIKYGNADFDAPRPDYFALARQPPTDFGDLARRPPQD